MHITWMSISGIPPFTEQIGVAFDEQVNLFVGPNATGKSTILRMLQSRETILRKFDFQLSQDWMNDPRMNFFRGNARNTPNLKEGVNLIPWIYVPAARLTLPMSNDSDLMSSLFASSSPSRVYDNGEEIEPANPSRRLNDPRYFFDGAEISRFYNEIYQLYRQRRQSPYQLKLSQNEEAKLKAYECVQTICADILVAGRTPGEYIYDQPVHGSERTIATIYENMSVETTDNTPDDLFIGDLSYGTQGTLLWIWYLALKIADSYNRIDNWDTASAILLIDEIENHLHPTWQRRVIPALLEHFPGLQIFATTHSPFVVAGREAGQVHQLIRDTDGLITAKTNTEPIKGLTADEISRKYLEVQDPTDLATAEAAQELRQLRDEGPRADEREEAERQKRMQQLRRLVDRDLLAGGPMARRREEFANRFREAMARRREEELNQDNG